MPTNLYGPHDNFNLETAHVLPALMRKFHLARLLREKKYDEIKKNIERSSTGFDLDLNLDLELNLAKLGITSEAVTVWGTGEPYREFLYVDDLAEVCLFLVNRYGTTEVGEFVNIGSGEDIKVKELADLIRHLLGFEGTIRYDSSKSDGTPRKLLDVSRMESLGWRPKIPLEEGIRRTYSWYLESMQPCG
jgi:GDP-L-fucose synthase